MPEPRPDAWSNRRKRLDAALIYVAIFLVALAAAPPNELRKSLASDLAYVLGALLIGYCGMPVADAFINRRRAYASDSEYPSLPDVRRRNPDPSGDRVDNPDDPPSTVGDDNGPNDDGRTDGRQGSGGEGRQRKRSFAAAGDGPRSSRGKNSRRQRQGRRVARRNPHHHRKGD